MKLFYLRLLIICLCISRYSIAKVITVNKETSSFIMCSNDTATPQQVITKFLKWYKINMHKANNFPILIKDSADNFMINKSACNKYLALLKSSGCLSYKYIAYWKSFFNDKAIGLENNPVQSDIPDGFDLDFVLITQEPELVLNHISEIKFGIVTRYENNIVVSLRWPQKDAMQYNFEMHKSTVGWQIDYISTPNFD